MATAASSVKNYQVSVMGHGGSNQQWLSTPTDNGNFLIESRSDGDRLDVHGASTSTGAVVDQWPATGAGNQQWELVQIS